MKRFIERHAGKVIGTISCFDRLLFRGYLPITSGAAMALYLKSLGVRREVVKAFVLEQAARLKTHALDRCTRSGRLYEYLSAITRKEDMARKIAERDRVKHGLVSKQGTKVSDSGGLQVYSKVLSGTGRRAVLLLNRSASAATITVRFADLGLGATASVRNVWTATDLGSNTTNFAVSVPSNDAVLLMVTEDTGP